MISISFSSRHTIIASLLVFGCWEIQHRLREVTCFVTHKIHYSSTKFIFCTGAWNRWLMNIHFQHMMTKEFQRVYFSLYLNKGRGFPWEISVNVLLPRKLCWSWRFICGKWKRAAILMAYIYAKCIIVHGGTQHGLQWTLFKDWYHFKYSTVSFTVEKRSQGVIWLLCKLTDFHANLIPILSVSISSASAQGFKAKWR